jgi:predicted GIY-YIG superfamily endonuclease
MTRSAITPAERTQALYRFFGANAQLLYIGITANLPGRLEAHSAGKPWWADVAEIKIEHLPTREAALKAERTAIVAEKPLHNIQHNQRRTRARVATPTPTDSQWTFASLCGGYERTGPLNLYWEVYGDPISDSYEIDEIDAEELWRTWLTRYPSDPDAEAKFGAGAFSISWYVEGAGTFEAAPWTRNARNFLTYYTWPINAITGERLQWPRLPLIDKVWRGHDLPKNYATKGGFIQEATGWKPSPLQPYVNIHQLAQVAGLYCPRHQGKVAQ